MKQLCCPGVKENKKTILICFADRKVFSNRHAKLIPEWKSATKKTYTFNIAF